MPPGVDLNGFAYGSLRRRLLRLSEHAPYSCARTSQALVIQEQYTQAEHQIVEERQVGSEDDAELKYCDDIEANKAESPREEKHPNQAEFDAECGDSQ